MHFRPPTPQPHTEPRQSAARWKFSEIIADDTVRQRWEKVRRYFFLRESAYDMTRRCNIQCDGCYYYQGDKQAALDNADPEAWRNLMQAEKARGITYVVLAGAEPTLVLQLCRVCYHEIPLGTIATNGLLHIPEDIGYRIHISVWGNDATSLKLRRAKNMLARQIEQYGRDPRAVFVYTFTRYNIAEAHEVAEQLAQHNCKLTFNVFSAPLNYTGELKHTPQSLLHMRQTMLELMQNHPEMVLFSTYNAVVHTHALGLHELFKCPYPRCNPSTSMGLGRSFRQYHADLSWQRESACCIPDTDCEDCRHYAAGSAIVTARMFRHADDPHRFRAWLDYVDTYLAVWVQDYERGAPLSQELTAPPAATDGSNQ